MSANKHIEAFMGVARKAGYIYFSKEDVSTTLKGMTYTLGYPNQEEEGSYLPQALPLLEQGMDIKEYRVSGTAEKSIRYSTEYRSDPIDLKVWYEGTKYVSKDKFRMALQRVWTENGKIYATDGYKAMYRLDGRKIFASLPVEFISIAKKIGGDWYLFDSPQPVNTCGLSDGLLHMTCERLVNFPDMENLTKDLTIVKQLFLPLKELREMAKNFANSYVSVKEDGRLLIDGQDTSLKAGVREMSLAGLPASLSLIMPRKGDGENLIELDLDYMKCLSPRKDGWIEVYLTEKGEKNSPTPLVVLY